MVVLVNFRLIFTIRINLHRGNNYAVANKIRFNEYWIAPIILGYQLSVSNSNPPDCSKQSCVYTFLKMKLSPISKFCSPTYNWRKGSLKVVRGVGNGLCLKLIYWEFINKWKKMIIQSCHLVKEVINICWWVGEGCQVYHQFLSSVLRITNRKSLYASLLFSFKIRLQDFVVVIKKGKRWDCFVKFQIIPPPFAPNWAITFKKIKHISFYCIPHPCLWPNFQLLVF